MRASRDDASLSARAPRAYPSFSPTIRALEMDHRAHLDHLGPLSHTFAELSRADISSERLQQMRVYAIQPHVKRCILTSSLVPFSSSARGRVRGSCTRREMQRQIRKLQTTADLYTLDVDVYLGCVWCAFLIELRFFRKSYCDMVFQGDWCVACLLRVISVLRLACALFLL